MILHIPNVLSKEQLIECRKLLNEADWIDGKTTAGSQAVNVKNNFQLHEKDSLTTYLREIITSSLSSNPLFISSALPSHIISPFFNRYENGGNYGNHVDNAIMYVMQKQKSYRTDISCSLFFIASLRFKVLCKRVLRGGTFSRILNIFKYTTECGSVYD